MLLIDDFEARFLLGVPALDRTHRELVDLLNRMGEASNAAFAYLYPDLVNHTHAHFANEEQLMRQTGYPASAEHAEEHARILAEMETFRRRLTGGRIALARAFVTEQLPPWVALHIATMDTALAAHVKAGMKVKGSG